MKNTRGLRACTKSKAELPTDPGDTPPLVQKAPSEATDKPHGSQYLTQKWGKQIRPPGLGSSRREYNVEEFEERNKALE